MVACDRKGIIVVGECLYSLELVVLYACNVNIRLALYGSTNVHLAAFDMDTADTVLLVVELSRLSASYHMVSP